MRSPYAQVALTYLRRPFSSGYAYLTILGGLLLTIVAPILLGFEIRENGIRSSHVFVFFLGMTVLFGRMVAHVKELLADPRARLMPNSCRVQLVVALGALLILVVAQPIVVALLAGLSCIGLTAVEVMWCALLFWCILAPSRPRTRLGIIAVLLEIIAVFAILFGPGGHILAVLFLQSPPPYPSLSIVALIGGLILVGMGGFRLARLDEDMAECTCWPGTALLGDGTATGCPQANGWAVGKQSKTRQWDRQAARLTRHVGRASVSWWSRICRWQAGMTTGRSAIGFSLLCLAAFAVAYLIDVPIRAHRHGVSLFFPAVMIALVLMLPTLMVAGVLWYRRNHCLPYESLLCVDRAAYLRQAGAAAALNQFLLWLCMAAGMSIWLLGVARDMPLAEVVSWLALSALAQPWLFGLCVWSLRFRSQMGSFVFALFVAMLMGAAGVMMAADSPLKTSRAIVLGVAAVFALLGVLLAWHAYRRWLATDFD
jgi:hypothetical protein